MMDSDTDDVYQRLDALQKKYDILHKDYVNLREQVEDLICEFEVEHFLEHGPGQEG